MFEQRKSLQYEMQQDVIIKEPKPRPFTQTKWILGDFGLHYFLTKQSCFDLVTVFVSCLVSFPFLSPLSQQLRQTCHWSTTINPPIQAVVKTPPLCQRTLYCFSLWLNYFVFLCFFCPRIYSSHLPSFLAWYLLTDLLCLFFAECFSFCPLVFNLPVSQLLLVLPLSSFSVLMLIKDLWIVTFGVLSLAFVVWPLLNHNIQYHCLILNKCNLLRGVFFHLPNLFWNVWTALHQKYSVS